MKKSDVSYITGVVFAAMFSFFYCCTMWFSIKLPRYYPLEHTWKWAKETGAISQSWYGMQGFAFLGAGIATVIIYLVIKFVISKDVTLRPAAAKLIGVISSVVILVCMGYIVWYEFSAWGIF